MAPRKTGAVPKSNKSSNKKPAKRNTTPPQTNKSAKSSASNLLSLESVNSLRLNAKQWLKYLQQADVFLDTLYSAGNNLQENGVLQKLIQQKGKNLSTGDFTAILMALMNTPLADRFFKGGEQSPAAPQNPAPSQQGQAAPVEAAPPGQPTAPGYQQNNPNGSGTQSQTPNPGLPVQPNGMGQQVQTRPGPGFAPNPYYGAPPYSSYGQSPSLQPGNPQNPGPVPSYGQPTPYPGYNPGPYQTMGFNPYSNSNFNHGTWKPFNYRRH